MDSDRPPPPPHRTTSTSTTTTTTTTSDLFICFTSRHHHHSSSSSSAAAAMKISSKSILSPGRPTTRDPPVSLSTSLSRRLKTSRSIKGGASPAMFPTSGKKRSGGAGFENPEPSSPKVTCIGQVRVKSKKKQRKKLRTLSRRHSTGDVSFRKLDHNHHSGDGFSRSQNLGSNFQQGCSSFGSNQEHSPEKLHNPRWVHLPLTICEALRAFGSEFSCLFPCRSSCFSPAPEREKEEKTDHRRGSSSTTSGSGSCAAVFTRWLVAFQDGDDGGGRDCRREIELVVGGDDDDDDDNDVEIRSIRTSRRHVFDDLEIVNDRIEGCNKDESRLSICIPPKNALLLMRCRSDPLKMEALANRLWEPTIDDYEEDEEEDEVEIPLKKEAFYHQETIFIQEKEDQETHKENQETHEEDEEITFFGSLFDEIVDQDQDQDQENEEMVDAKEELFEEEIQETQMESNFDEKVKVFEEEEEMVTQFGDRSESKERDAGVLEREAGVLEREGLPECLLLMMCEPKLSMEVSKETWVSSKDFIRRHSSRKKPPPPPQPPAPVKPTAGQSESKVSSTTTTTTTLSSTTKYKNQMTAEDAAAAAAAVAAVQPGRSSCSLPAPPSMAEMLEQKLVNAVGYEPFVLTRCKSEPMRTAAAKLAPDSCFWKNRKLEPLRRASFGVGAAGVGF